MLLSLVPLHATSLNEEEDSISNELVVDDELSTDSNAEESNNTEPSLSSEQEISSSTVSNNDVEEIKTSDETESSLSDLEEDIAEQQDILTMADEEIEEPENDNWKLGLVFYDSTVNNGKTPLKEINWDASDGGYGTGEARVITVQINYKNTNAVTTYQPGELEISIPSLIYRKWAIYDDAYNAQIKTSVLIGANDSSHTGYDWNFNSKTDDDIYKFTNFNLIEEKSNFEGSIQIEYTLTPMSEQDSSSNLFVEKYENECVHNYNKILKASLNTIESNEINFNYTRTYNHPWKREEYNVTKTANKIESFDNLPNNAHQFIWVKYGFWHTGGFVGSNYPILDAKNGIYKDIIPEGCIVYDERMNLLEVGDDGYYTFKASLFSRDSTYIYVGYPKNIYNEENKNLHITNEVELWGTYRDRTETEFFDKDSIDINLADFEFIYSGNLYGIYKNGNSKLYYQDIINKWENNIATWGIKPNAIYSGSPMTIKIGDDLLFATSENGEPQKLNDEDYYFSNIAFESKYFINGNGNEISEGKYDCELWIRQKNSNEYVLQESFKNPQNKKSWNFNEDDNVVAFYLIINDMTESIVGNSSVVNNLLSASTIFKKKDIPENGELYNFDYIQVYYKDLDGNLILQNEPELNSYSNEMTKMNIANFDKNKYGKYMQRATSKASWKPYILSNPTAFLSSQKSFTGITQDAKNELFFGKCNLSAIFDSLSVFNERYKDQYDTSYAIQGFKIYDLLPKGIEITSTENDIANSFHLAESNLTAMVKNTNLEGLKYSDVINNTTSNVKIIHNWKNTGRTKIEIEAIFKDPIFLFGDYQKIGRFIYNFDYKITYDSILEYGKSFTNYCYVDILETQKKGVQGGPGYRGWTSDTGVYDMDAKDIDEDGSTSDYLAYNSSIVTISSIISTHQDVIKYVKTDKSDFSVGKVESSYNSEYKYKLRVRTGSADITNLVIYDSLEEYAQNPNGDIVPAYGTKKHWNGEFLGIDTSYAESKGYVVKPYYSENVLAGNLYNDDGTLNTDWIEYANNDYDEYKFGEPKTITSPNWPNNYNSGMQETNDFWELSYPGAEFIEIKFDSTCKLESATYDYLRFYDKDGNNITSSVCGISANKIGSSDMAGKTYTIPSDYVKITMRTDGSGQYKGFSANVVSKTYVKTVYATDKSKVKALAFEYLDTDGNPAKLPANSLTYVLIKMKSPADENITSLAYNGCRTQWQALDDYDKPVDFITGINSNIVKVSLPNSVEDREVNLSFNKIIDATDEDFEKMKLNKDDAYNFFISLTNQETGDIINGLLDSKEGFRVNNIPIGTYIIEEQNDIWFHFISMALMQPIEGIDFKEENGAYIITIGASVESGVTAEICVTNKPDEERFYDSKYDIKNLFTMTM